jgi:hypothetical protein
MRHPVMFVLEVAEAVTKVGEVTVELLAGAETVTFTEADAHKDVHTNISATIHSFNLIFKKTPVATGA